jgi:hypothetical protein
MREGLNEQPYIDNQRMRLATIKVKRQSAFLNNRFVLPQLILAVL